MVKACFVLLFKHQTNEVDMQNFWISLGNNFSQMHVSWSELLLDTWGSLPDLLSLSYTDWAQNLMFYWYFILLSPKFGLKYRVSFSYCLGDWKDWKYVWKYFMFATWMVNKLDHSGKSKKISITVWLKKTLSARNFFFMTKVSFVQLKGGFKGHKRSVEFLLELSTKGHQNKKYLICITFAQYPKWKIEQNLLVQHWWWSDLVYLYLYSEMQHPQKDLCIPF